MKYDSHLRRITQNPPPMDAIARQNVTIQESMQQLASSPAPTPIRPTAGIKFLRHIEIPPRSILCLQVSEIAAEKFRPRWISGDGICVRNYSASIISLQPSRTLEIMGTQVSEPAPPFSTTTIKASGYFSSATKPANVELGSRPLPT